MFQTLCHVCLQSSHRFTKSPVRSGTEKKKAEDILLRTRWHWDIVRREFEPTQQEVLQQVQLVIMENLYVTGWVSLATSQVDDYSEGSDTITKQLSVLLGQCSAAFKQLW